MQLLRDMGGLPQCLSTVTLGTVAGFNQVESPIIIGFYQYNLRGYQKVAHRYGHGYHDVEMLMELGLVLRDLTLAAETTAQLVPKALYRRAILVSTESGGVWWGSVVYQVVFMSHLFSFTNFMFKVNSIKKQRLGK